MLPDWVSSVVNRALAVGEADVFSVVARSARTTNRDVRVAPVSSRFPSTTARTAKRRSTNMVGNRQGGTGGYSEANGRSCEASSKEDGYSQVDSETERLQTRQINVDPP